VLSRRDFFKVGLLSLGGLALLPGKRWLSALDFPRAERLGRVNVGKVELKSRPDIDSNTVKELYEDAVVVRVRELTGRHPYRINQRWVETPDGYIWSPYLQPVENTPNQPVNSLPETSIGNGMWVEVSVPYVNLMLANPPARAPWLQVKLDFGLTPRLYFSQISWVDQTRVDDAGQVWYRINEPYGSYGDIFWARAEALRPLTREEMAPINPEVEDKRVVVNVSNQTLSCFEGSREVYFARISTGALYNAAGERVDVWETPIGRFPIWRKLVALHMSGGTTGGGWDLPAVGWVSLFVGSGVAVHSTFWHNNFGVPMSNGCVNASPEDSRWVFRWTQPVVEYDPGDRTVSMPGGTQVEVIEN
ncbi:MAG: L,D-transpeptidase, partial [Anaerolineales bacterium]|nr:L,D-transpeptidase [Anaerolineales bacterium]